MVEKLVGPGIEPIKTFVLGQELAQSLRVRNAACAIVLQRMFQFTRKGSGWIFSHVFRLNPSTSAKQKAYCAAERNGEKTFVNQ
jgi:hypothetical protein